MNHSFVLLKVLSYHSIFWELQKVNHPWPLVSFFSYKIDEKTLDFVMGGGGQMVSVLVFYSDNLSSIPPEVNSFLFCKIIFKMNL